MGGGGGYMGGGRGPGHMGQRGGPAFLSPSPHTHARSICNVRFHTFRLVRYGRMGVPTDKATYGVGSLRLKTAQCRQIKTRPDTRPIPLADGWRKCAFSRLPTRSPRTDQRTDQRTDKASYRVARPQLTRPRKLTMPPH